MKNYLIIGKKSQISQSIKSVFDKENINYKIISTTEFNESYLKNGNVRILYLSINRNNLLDSEKKLKNVITKINKYREIDLIYFSSINSKEKYKTYYGEIKRKCEEIVRENNQFIIRCGFINVNNSSNKNNKKLLFLANNFYRLIFPKKSVFYLTNFSSIIDYIKIKNLNEIQELFDEKFLLNDYLIKLNNSGIAINITFLIYILRNINKNYYIKSQFSKLLNISSIES